MRYQYKNVFRNIRGEQLHLINETKYKPLLGNKLLKSSFFQITCDLNDHEILYLKRYRTIGGNFNNCVWMPSIAFACVLSCSSTNEPFDYWIT